MRFATLRGLLTGGTGFCAGAALTAAATALPAAQAGGAAAWLLLPWSRAFAGLGVTDIPSATSALIADLALAGCGVLAAWLAFESAPFRRAADRRPEGAERLDAARSTLEGEIIKAMTLLRAQVAKNDNHSAALERSQSRLESSQTREQVGRVIRYLVSENEEMRRANVDYARQLNESRTQVETLRSQLTLSQEITSRDTLTKAYSRKHFDSAIAAAVRNAGKTNSNLSLVMADIDEFKAINDTFGHLVGDEVLKNVAEMMIGLGNERDCVARFGGEEFAIIVPDQEAFEAAALANKIRMRLESKSWSLKDGQALGKVTASFGVAQLKSGESSSGLIRRADAKLYESKAAGRNRVSH